MKVNVGKTVSQEELERATIGDIRAAADDTIAVAHSNAKKNLEALLDNSLPALEPFLWTDSRTGNEIQFYIKRLGSIDIAEISLSINRDASGALQLYAPDSSPAAMVQQIIIKACVCEENGQPFFVTEDLKAFYNRPELVEMFLDLFIACDQVNPCILNTLKKT